MRQDDRMRAKVCRNVRSTRCCTCVSPAGMGLSFLLLCTLETYADTVSSSVAVQCSKLALLLADCLQAQAIGYALCLALCVNGWATFRRGRASSSSTYSIVKYSVLSPVSPQSNWMSSLPASKNAQFADVVEHSGRCRCMAMA